MVAVACNVPEFDPRINEPAAGTNRALHLLGFVVLSALVHIFILRQLAIQNFSIGRGVPASDVSMIAVDIEHWITPAPGTVATEPARPTVHVDPVEPAVVPVEPGTREETEQDLPAPVPDTAGVRNQGSIPGLEVLMDNTAREVEKTAREMEALVGPGSFMTESYREQLERAQRDDSDSATRQRGETGRVVYTNPMGDYIVRTGDTCMTIPALLLPYTFKEGNSIIAMPDDCGSSKSDSRLAVEKIIGNMTSPAP